MTNLNNPILPISIKMWMLMKYIHSPWRGKAKNTIRKYSFFEGDYLVIPRGMIYQMNLKMKTISISLLNPVILFIHLKI